MTDVNDDGVTEPGSDSSSPASADATELESEMDLLSRERDELLDTARRVQAEFENYKKRMMREQTALVERANESLLEQLLPVLDNFELTLTSVVGSEGDEQIKKGVELVYAGL